MVATLALVVVLTGCGPTNPPGAPGGSPSTPATATATPTPTATHSATAAPAAVVVTLDAIIVKDADGVTLESAPLNRSSAMLTLLSGILGPVPAPITSQSGMRYEWPGVRYFVSHGFGRLRVDVPTVGGLFVEAPGGIRVGSMRADVVALAPFDDGYDGDGDGKSDNLGLTPRHVPGSTSLMLPGQVGTEYVRVQFSGDTVTVLDSPGNDFQDL